MNNKINAPARMAKKWCFTTSNLSGITNGQHKKHHKQGKDATI